MKLSAWMNRVGLLLLWPCVVIAADPIRPVESWSDYRELLIADGQTADAADARIAELLTSLNGMDRNAGADRIGLPAPPFRFEGWLNSDPLALDDLRGRVLLSDFSDGALASAEVRDLMTRVTASEEPLIGAPPTGIDHGEVVVTLRGVAGVIDRVTCRHYPGSPAAPATQSAMHTKIDDCLRLYTAAAPVPLAREDLLSWLDRFIGPVDTGSTDT